ncbi:peptide chain release factor N(5)-glutamine methyltransferase [Cerasicoccus fimbriatus]|uniref:peptide chain release factor N(5)-glutamine methyltransferase n=1 Tax=Cerasicoccus fimbriatus TaxID=3014554 RepID=UPI0022B43CE4|nr:peptide chain release factor N(5)-glutamine methyltransferase [Cerasicoccus sp. TK19100]
MQSVLEILQKTTAYFEQKGVPDAKLNAERLMAHVLECTRLDLYLQFERPLTEDLLAALRPLVGRRAKREPLQYIIGETDFLDLKLKCDRRALIPRQETEELADLLIRHFGKTPPASVLDLGTGIGALALSLAQAWPDAAVTAVDVSADALALARENAAANELERVNFLQSDWFAAVNGSFDLIVTNPPYLTEKEMTTAEPEVVKFEPSSALVAGDDGLRDLETIIEKAPKRLTDNGLLVAETGISQHAVLADMARRAGFAKSESQKDLDGRPRFFWAWK